MRKFNYSYEEFSRYMNRCGFTEDEEKILCLRRRGKSNQAICYELSISESTLTRKLKSISNKIIREI